MPVRGFISGLCVGAAVCFGGTAIARGPEAGPPAATTDVPAAKEPVKINKSEAMPLGKPKETATPKAGATKGNMLFEPGTLTTVLSLGAVLGVIGIVAFIAKKASMKAGGLWSALGPGGRAPSGILEVLGRYPVGRGCTLVLLKLDRRILLVSQSAGGKFGGTTMSTLCEVTDVEDVASILLKSRDEETEQSMHKFESMLTDADKAFKNTRRGEILTEPVPLPVRNVKRAQIKTVPTVPARHDSGRGRSSLEVRG